MSDLLRCMHPLAQSAALAILAASVIHLVAIRKLKRHGYGTALLLYGALLLLTLWLGSYHVSALGFSSGRIPLLRGFLVTRSNRTALKMASRQTISLGYGSIVEIQPEILAGPVDCTWLSTTGGVFDDPANCDTAFAASGAAQYDVLKVRVRSACGLPTAVGEIRVAILP